MAGDLLTADEQIEWRGLVLGAGTPYGWRSLEGWLDLPEVAAADSDRGDRHGQYAGRLHVRGRVITYTYVTRQVSLAAFPLAVAALRAATVVPEDADEEPLVVRLHGVRHQVMARVVRRTIPQGLHYSLGHAVGVIQWRATSAYIQQLPALDVQVPLPSPVTEGLMVPLQFPLSLGPGQLGGEITVTNGGNAPAWPRFTFTGPVVGPRIVAPDLGGLLEFNPAWSVPADQQIEVDTDARTVTIVGSGVSRDDQLWVRGWFPLPPQVPVRIQWSAAGGYSAAATLHILTHHTSM